MSKNRLDQNNYQNDYDDAKKIDLKKTWMIIIISIVVILFLISSVVLGSQLYKMSTRDQYTVDLKIGDPEGSVELFKIEYANETGEITVKGENTDSVIAPGTSVDYDIRLRNADTVIIDFLMAPRVEFYGGESIPVEFKIIDSHGNYILGTENTWATAEQLSAFAHRSSIHPGETYTYHVTWRWVFEVDNAQDGADTALGNQNGEVTPGISVGIETFSTSSALPVKSNTHMMHLVGESFGCCWCCYIVWLLLLICVVLVIWVCRTTQKLRDLKAEVKMFALDEQDAEAGADQNATDGADDTAGEQ